MSFKDRMTARVFQLVLGRMMRPQPALLLRGRELPAPEPMTVPTAAGPVRVLVYRPAAAPADALPPVYVNFHGGGFIVRHPEFDDHLCRAVVADTGCVLVNVDYDVAPQRPFPVAPEQAFGVTAWVAQHGAEHGWDGARLAVGGQSSGGNLATGVCLAARQQGSFLPLLQILNFPPLDLATDPNSKVARTTKPLIPPSMAALFNNAYAPDPAHRRDPLVSPLFAPDLTGMPPALIITAEYDLLADEGAAYAARLAEAGVPVVHHVMPGVDHAFTHSGPVDPLSTALSLMTQALERAWVSPGARPDVLDEGRS